MNLNKIRPKNETGDSLLSITKNCETLIEQTKTKPQETLESKITKPRKTFSLEPSFILGLDSNWMVGLTSLDVYNSICNINTTNNKFELYADELSIEQLKDELDETLSISDITPYHPQHEKR